MNNDLSVIRGGYRDPITGACGGERFWVGGRDLGEFRDIVDAEYERAKREYPRNPAFRMRPIFCTGSPFGAEILELVEQVRGAK